MLLNGIRNRETEIYMIQQFWLKVSQLCASLAKLLPDTNGNYGRTDAAHCGGYARAHWLHCVVAQALSERFTLSEFVLLAPWTRSSCSYLAPPAGFWFEPRPSCSSTSTSLRWHCAARTAHARCRWGLLLLLRCVAFEQLSCCSAEWLGFSVQAMNGARLSSCCILGFCVHEEAYHGLRKSKRYIW